MDVVDTAEEAGELELPPLVVREPLERFLDGHGIGSGRVEAERIGDGHSNITFLVRRGDARVVLRRPPRPPLPPSAHDVLREARLLRALEGTPVRVPARARRGRRRGRARRALLRDGGGATGTCRPARSRRRSTPWRSAAACARSSWTRLVEIHAVDWRACGLEGYGKPTGYLERQLRRFTGLWEHNKTRELDVVDRARRMARPQPPRVARRRRSCTATTGSAT